MELKSPPIKFICKTPKSQPTKARNTCFLFLSFNLKPPFASSSSRPPSHSNVSLYNVFALLNFNFFLSSQQPSNPWSPSIPKSLKDRQVYKFFFILKEKSNITFAPKGNINKKKTEKNVSTKNIWKKSKKWWG